MNKNNIHISCLRILWFVIIIFIFFNARTQNNTKPKVDSIISQNGWKHKFIYQLTGTQSSFVNWNAGGRNNLSLIGTVITGNYYSKGASKWSTDLTLSLGGIKYLDNIVGNSLQKTDDKIDLSSIYGQKITKYLFFSLNMGFRTQFLDGFNLPNDSIRVSTFLAPGYLNLAFGIDFIKNDKFSIFASPFAFKGTIVGDQKLADSGAFGVDKAILDSQGNIISGGRNFREEYGAYIKAKWNKTIMKNIELKSRLELFSNYIINPENIDVNAELILLFKINKLFSATTQFNLIYDDDIKIKDRFGKTGPRTQFKSVLGIGVYYKVENP
ncbi:MAG: DUF3078 domain-containing protein [Bacteroidetes bacterium]|nr:DUF3078 domain-containing protein [Bacteroidota bacterium]